MTIKYGDTVCVTKNWFYVVTHVDDGEVFGVLSETAYPESYPEEYLGEVFEFVKSRTENYWVWMP